MFSSDSDLEAETYFAPPSTMVDQSGVYLIFLHVIELKHFHWEIL